MPSSQTWSEFNGGTAGTVAPTETTLRGDCNWKATYDDSTTGYAAAPVPAGIHSMHKIQSLKFTNSSASIANVYGLVYTISANGNAASATPFWKVMAAVPASGTMFVPASQTAMPAIGTATPVFMPTSIGSAIAGTWGTGTYTAGGTTGLTQGPFSAAAGAGSSATPVQIPATTGVLYATALYTQLQTYLGAQPGPISATSLTITATWTES